MDGADGAAPMELTPAQFLELLELAAARMRCSVQGRVGGERLAQGVRGMGAVAAAPVRVEDTAEMVVDIAHARPIGLAS
jgi:hypothetical protein